MEHDEQNERCGPSKPDTSKAYRAKMKKDDRKQINYWLSNEVITTLGQLVERSNKGPHALVEAAILEYAQRHYDIASTLFQSTVRDVANHCDELRSVMSSYIISNNGKMGGQRQYCTSNS